MIRFIGVLSGILISTGLYFLASDRPGSVTPADPVEIVQVMSPDTSPPALPVPAEAQIMQQTQVQTSEQTTDLPTDASSPPEPITAAPLSADIEAGAAPDNPTHPTALTAVFWRPFKSHYSASGFARRMTSATGIEIKVLPTDKRQYEVAFSYLDEEDRLSKGEVIERITGLSLDGNLLP